MGRSRIGLALLVPIVLAAGPAAAVDKDALARLRPGMSKAEVVEHLGLQGRLAQVRYQQQSGVERWAICWHKELGDVPVGMGDYGACKGKQPDGQLLFRDDVLVAIQRGAG